MKIDPAPISARRSRTGIAGEASDSIGALIALEAPAPGRPLVRRAVDPLGCVDHPTREVPLERGEAP
ncbi:MAG: hypothetical protein ABI678_04425 [Kofleriaceae bacterium]